MTLDITEENYPSLLNRFDELWSMKETPSELILEMELLADLISEFESHKFPLMNNPTYRDLLNERLKKQVLRQVNNS